MPVIELDMFSTKGIAPDLAQDIAPQQFLTSANGARYTNRGMSAASVWSDPDITTVPICGEYWDRGSRTDIILLDGTDCYLWEPDVANRNIGSITATRGECFIEVFAGVPVISNGAEPKTITGSYPSETLSSLTAWPSGTYAKQIVGFGPYLVAVGITESGTEYPHRVMWSHPADPGSLPASWDYTDPTKDAGVTELSDEENGSIVCTKVLGDALYIYKERAVWRARIIGYPYILKFEKMHDGSGALGINAVATVPGLNAHVIMSSSGLWLNDGNQVRRIGEGTVTDEYLSRMNVAFGKNSFVIKARGGREVWLSFPTSSSDNDVFIWDWRLDAFTEMVSSGVTYAFESVIDVSTDEGIWGQDVILSWGGDNLAWGTDSLTWGDISLEDEADTETWDSDASIWGPLYVAGAYVVTSSGVHRLGYGQQRKKATIRREFYPMFTESGNGAIVSISSRKFLRRIWLRGSGSADARVRLGVSEKRGDSISWGSWKDFTFGDDHYVDMTGSGRYMHFEVEIPPSVNSWHLEGLRIEVSERSRF